MSFWLRELAGWLLVALGLYVFLIVATEMLNPAIQWAQYLEAGPMILIGFILFRGGIHLLKVAVAARICTLPQAEPNPPAEKPTRRPPRPTPWEE
jgi:hypothetical protein